MNSVDVNYWEDGKSFNVNLTMTAGWPGYGLGKCDYPRVDKLYCLLRI